MSNFPVCLPGWQKILSALVTFLQRGGGIPRSSIPLEDKIFSSNVGCQSMLGGAAPSSWSTKHYHRLNTAHLNINIFFSIGRIHPFFT